MLPDELIEENFAGIPPLLWKARTKTFDKMPALAERLGIDRRWLQREPQPWGQCPRSTDLIGINRVVFSVKTISMDAEATDNAGSFKSELPSQDSSDVNRNPQLGPCCQSDRNSWINFKPNVYPRQSPGGRETWSNAHKLSSSTSQHLRCCWLITSLNTQNNKFLFSLNHDRSNNIPIRLRWLCRDMEWTPRHDRVCHRPWDRIAHRSRDSEPNRFLNHNRHEGLSEPS